jgi:site-specific DNA-methyltransferase (adenine-specific)
MDPFAGLGSTAVACARLGVRFDGCDIDETYLSQAAERMEQAVLEQAATDKRPAKVRRSEPKVRKATAAS